MMTLYLFCFCCEMEALHKIAEHYRLVLIEDAAQAIGAEFPFPERTAKAGTMGEGGLFSFYPSKNLGAAGDAGMVVCRDDKLAQKLRTFREHGMEPRYFHHFIGGNFRLDEMQATILAVKLPHLETWAAARRAAADLSRDFSRSAAICGQRDCRILQLKSRALAKLLASRRVRAISTRKAFVVLTGRYRSGQTGQTVNLLALRLRWFESSPAQTFVNTLMRCSRLTALRRFERNHP